MKNTKMIVDAVLKGLRKHAPKIAVGVGGALLLTGGYLLGREVPKYKKEVEEKSAELEEGEKLPVKEKAKIAAKHFAAPACAIAGGTMALCLSVHENEKRIAIGTTAATALSKLTEAKSKELKEYKEAVKEIVSEEDNEKIESTAVQKREESITAEALDIPPYAPAPGMHWCKDEVFGGQWFQTDIPTLQMCEIEGMRRLQAEGYGGCITLNEIYELIGHELIGVGEVFGCVYDPQKSGKMVDIRIGSAIVNGQLILTIAPNVDIIDPDYFDVADRTY